MLCQSLVVCANGRCPRCPSQHLVKDGSQRVEQTARHIQRLFQPAGLLFEAWQNSQLISTHDFYCTPCLRHMLAQYHPVYMHMYTVCIYYKDIGCGNTGNGLTICTFLSPDFGLPEKHFTACVLTLLPSELLNSHGVGWKLPANESSHMLEFRQRFHHSVFCFISLKQQPCKHSRLCKNIMLPLLGSQGMGIGDAAAMFSCQSSRRSCFGPRRLPLTGWTEQVSGRRSGRVCDALKTAYLLRPVQKAFRGCL